MTTRPYLHSEQAHHRYLSSDAAEKGTYMTQPLLAKERLSQALSTRGRSFGTYHTRDEGSKPLEHRCSIDSTGSTSTAGSLGDQRFGDSSTDSRRSSSASSSDCYTFSTETSPSDNRYLYLETALQSTSKSPSMSPTRTPVDTDSSDVDSPLGLDEHDPTPTTSISSQSREIWEAELEQSEKNQALISSILDPKRKIKKHEKQLIKQISKQLQKYLSKVEADQMARAVVLGKGHHAKAFRKQTGLPQTFVMEGSKAWIHLKEEIGKGKFKKTYRALVIDLETGKVKLTAHQKILDPRHIPAAIKEIEYHTLVHDHANVPTLYSSRKSFNRGYERLAIYQEFCDIPLDERVKDPKNFSFYHKVEIAQDIASALAHTHKKGFSHNDIKLQNALLLLNKGKLSDFGIAQKLGECPWTINQDLLAPEQRQNPHHTPVNEYTDAFQFGLLLIDLFAPQLNEGHPLAGDYQLSLKARYPLLDKGPNKNTIPMIRIRQFIRGCLVGSSLIDDLENSEVPPDYRHTMGYLAGQLGTLLTEIGEQPDRGSWGYPVPQHQPATPKKLFRFHQRLPS